ncbi:biotin synthase BioB [Candidatus Sororendozoicomonas aggregata]|uniref:biotin synthase BioB n=1 Tax=Candidatus Sororendozoicomonas aggregata TaxID=3073239 RepID=UPI002ED04D02
MTSNHRDIRNDWTIDEVAQLFDMPFNDLLMQAQTLHRTYFQPNQLQASILLSIKTGACPEDCKYCAQSGHYNTGLTKEKLIQVEKVVQAARKAKESGATRFCMGAAWRNPPAKDMPMLIEMIQQVKALDLETCMTLGMLSRQQADTLAKAGLDYYNHNLDTSPEHYGNIITTRSYADRLETLAHVRDSGMKVCCGGILGLGETLRDRVSLLRQLANLPEHPESVPVNRLSKIAGTPMENAEEVSGIEFVKTIAAARIMMPKSYIRLAAGRETMSDELQALAYMAGANSIFSGEKLLTTPNAEPGCDMQLFTALGVTLETYEETISHNGNPEKSEKSEPELTPSPLFYEARPLAEKARA